MKKKITHASITSALTAAREVETVTRAQWNAARVEVERALCNHHCDSQEVYEARQNRQTFWARHQRAVGYCEGLELALEIGVFS